MSKPSAKTKQTAAPVAKPASKTPAKTAEKSSAKTSAKPAPKVEKSAAAAATTGDAAARPAPKTAVNITWCLARFGKDLNWWVKKTSDPVNWDMVDGLSILDPKQLAYVLELLDPLRDYGLSSDIVENAFIPFQLGPKQEDNPAEKIVRLLRVNELVQESDAPIFALPDVVNEESSAYATFLDHISAVRVRFLNDSIQFEQKLTVDEMEEHLREIQNQTYTETKALHVFREVADILEFIPEGYDLPESDEQTDSGTDTETREDDAPVGYDDIPDEAEPKMEEDETMIWDEDARDASAENGSFDDHHER
ncbi:MAG: hypothetical protein LBR07_08200 [Puniceicoccales bacterium]|jgi:hypothetical protein|nr:hypothetical protein [Puniceicoccales bacterium]